MRHFPLAVLLFFVLNCASRQDANLEPQFSYLKKEIPTIELEIRYFGTNNFTGRSVNGYESPIGILSTKATKALAKVQKELKEQGLGLKVFDSYRPQRAVTSFDNWAKNTNDTIAKRAFYPDIDKKNLFKLGYIASKSGHSRGSTLDLTIIHLETKQELDMGSTFDFFGPISHHNTNAITAEQKQNRELLRTTMLKYGFKEYAEEWWHYTLKNEPFPTTYFDFEIK